MACNFWLEQSDEPRGAWGGVKVWAYCRSGRVIIWKQIKQRAVVNIVNSIFTLNNITTINLTQINDTRLPISVTGFSLNPCIYTCACTCSRMLEIREVFPLPTFPQTPSKLPWKAKDNLCAAVLHSYYMDFELANIASIAEHTVVIWFHRFPNRFLFIHFLSAWSPLPLTFRLKHTGSPYYSVVRRLHWIHQQLDSTFT